MKNRKRGQNEGSVFQRKDGRWCGMLSLGWENGKRKRKSFFAATAAEVRDLLLKARSDHARGLPVAIERQTVKQFLDRWLQDSVKPAVRPRTYESYELTVRLHLAPALGHILLEKLAPQHVQTLLNCKPKDGLSPRSIAYLRVVLRRALNQALKWDLVVRNAAALAEPPRTVRHESNPLTPEQSHALLLAVKGARLEAFYTVALALGMRRGEVLGLRWQDVDFGARTLKVRQAIQRIAGKLTESGNSGLIAAEPKTERSRRTIAMPDVISKALKNHRVRQLEERLSAGAAWQENGLVFPNSIGAPLDPKALHRDFKRLLSEAALPSIRLHDLRHSAASLLLAQGIPMRTIMELLGHSSITLTADTYSHLRAPAMREAADKMDLILRAR